MDSIISPDQQPRLYSAKSVSTEKEELGIFILAFGTPECVSTEMPKTQVVIAGLGFSTIEEFLNAENNGDVSEENKYLFDCMYADDLKAIELNREICKSMAADHQSAWCVISLIKQINQLKQEIDQLKHRRNNGA
jgi:hypothetical protein